MARNQVPLDDLWSRVLGQRQHRLDEPPNRAGLDRRALVFFGDAS